MTITIRTEYLKRILAGVLLGAMVTCSTAALAIDDPATDVSVVDTTTENGSATDGSDVVGDPQLPDNIPDDENPGYGALYYAAVKKNIRNDSVYGSNMPSGWAKKCDTSKTKVVSVSAKADAEEVYVAWKTKSKAVSYEIQLSRTSGFKKSEYMFKIAEGTTYIEYTQYPETSYIFDPSERKTYYVRVRAVYESGVPGPWSKTVKFKTDGKFHR